MSIQVDKQPRTSEDTRKLLVSVLAEGKKQVVFESAVIEGSSRKEKEKEQLGETSVVLVEMEKIENVNSSQNGSKFKKVEMPVFNGRDLNAWLFRADLYFSNHKLTKSEKMTVAVISFEGVALDWFRGKDEQTPFKDWKDLKDKLLVRFRSSKKGSARGQFLAIKQETTVEEYQILFNKLVAPFSQLFDQVLEETFMNGLLPWIKAEVECWEPVRLTSMMKIAKNRELTRNEAGLEVNTICKAQSQTTITKNIILTVTKENMNANETLAMQTITLQGFHDGE